jgi:hypothetical protein
VDNCHRFTKIEDNSSFFVQMRSIWWSGGGKAIFQFRGVITGVIVDDRDGDDPTKLRVFFNRSPIRTRCFGNDTSAMPGAARLGGGQPSQFPRKTEWKGELDKSYRVSHIRCSIDKSIEENLFHPSMFLEAIQHSLHPYQCIFAVATSTPGKRHLMSRVGFLPESVEPIRKGRRHSRDDIPFVFFWHTRKEKSQTMPELVSIVDAVPVSSSYGR